MEDDNIPFTLKNRQVVPALIIASGVRDVKLRPWGRVRAASAISHGRTSCRKTRTPQPSTLHTPTRSYARLRLPQAVRSHWATLDGCLHVLSRCVRRRGGLWGNLCGSDTSWRGSCLCTRGEPRTRGEPLARRKPPTAAKGAVIGGAPCACQSRCRCARAGGAVLVRRRHMSVHGTRPSARGPATAGLRVGDADPLSRSGKPPRAGRGSAECPRQAPPRRRRTEPRTCRCTGSMAALGLGHVAAATPDSYDARRRPPPRVLLSAAAARASASAP